MTRQERKGVRFELVLSESERKIFSEAAASKGYSLAAWMRNACRMWAIRENAEVASGMVPRQHRSAWQLRRETMLQSGASNDTISKDDGSRDTISPSDTQSLTKR